MFLTFSGFFSAIAKNYNSPVWIVALLDFHSQVKKTEIKPVDY